MKIELYYWLLKPWKTNKNKEKNPRDNLQFIPILLTSTVYLHVKKPFTEDLIITINYIKRWLTN